MSLRGTKRTCRSIAAQGTHDQPNVCPSKIAMRSVLALGLLITLCASADAATVRRFKPHERHLRPTQGVTVPGVTKRASRFPDGPTNRPGIGCITAAPPLA